MADTGSIRRWNRTLHRRAGILLLVPLTIACVTGLILNHTVDLDLAAKRVNSPWVLARYGMTLKGDPAAFGLGGKALAGSWDGKIFLGKQVLEDAQPLVGAVPLRDGTAVVTAGAVHYFGLDGELIETMDGAALPATPISRAGRSRDFGLTLETASGLFTADSDLLGFTATPAGQVTEWSSAVPAADAEREIWREAYAGGGVPLDQVILDLHSGRFFGTVGKWIYDLTVVGVLILSATGFVLFLKTRRRSA